MPTQGLIIEPVNFQELSKAFSATPVLTTRFVRGAFWRFTKRVRRRTIQQMTGKKARGPFAKAAGDALFGGQFKRGGHVKARAMGDDLASLKAVNKISRILRVHEEGATITPHAGAFLFLSRKTGVAGKGTIFARVKSVTIPKRLHFVEAWQKEIPQGEREVLDAADRAMRAALDQNMKALTAAVQRVTSL